MDYRELITDRTLEDVVAHTKKGFYNVEDLKRIHKFILYVKTSLNLNFSLVDLSTIQVGYVLTIQDMESLLNAINIIRNNWYVSTDTPNTPNVYSFDYNKANDIEKILKVFCEYLLSVQIDIKYSGMFTLVSGQDVIIGE